MKCVSQEGCGCYDGEGKHYKEGEVIPSEKNCHNWYVTLNRVTASVGAKISFHLTFFSKGNKTLNSDKSDITQPCLNILYSENLVLSIK